MSPITAGVLSLVSVGASTDSLSATAASGGTTPYSYQWYRATVTGFSPGAGNLVSGATALTLSDTSLIPGTQYYYKMVVIDSAATPESASYSQLAVLTRGQSDLPITNVVTISVSAAQAGVGEYNVNNVALFSSDTPDPSFGSLGYKIYVSPSDVATDFGTSSITYQMAVNVFSQKPNILAGGGYLVIIPFLSNETIDDAIVRTTSLVQYFGIMGTLIFDQADMLDAAATIQSLNKMGFFVSNQSVDVLPGGMLDLLTTGGFTQSRGLYYGSVSEDDALLMMAAYAGRGLSVDFQGTNTTITMHLKDLANVQPDPSMNQTLLTQCQEAGVDVYISLQGVPKVFCSGENRYFDQVYNQGWFVGALQVAGFNYLATTSTKIPQTEPGMTGLKGAYRRVCNQGVTNQYLAPGEWTSPDTFGNLADFYANILQYGYYIYSAPISQQLPSQRAARIAPLVQIAAKEAGAIQKSNVLVFINA